jgi:hypothetical protein
VLARLEELPGVRHATTDQAADYLRLEVDEEAAVRAVRAELRRLGYGSDAAVHAPDRPRWYDAGSVGELSLVEARTIASRIAPVVAARHGLDAAATERLRATITDALHGAFVAFSLGSGTSGEAFREACVADVSRAVSAAFDADTVGEVRHALTADLKQVHKP